MISAQVWTQLEFTCRHVRQNAGLFGSLQILVAGDIRQLKPVPNSLYKDHGSSVFNPKHGNVLWLMLSSWDRVMHQEKPIFIKAIHDLSTCGISHDTDVFLETLRRPFPPNDRPTFLLARNYDVIMACYACLSELNGPKKIYHAADEGDNSQLSRWNVPKNLVLKKRSTDKSSESIVTDWEMELSMRQLSSNTTTTETGDSDTHEVSKLPPSFNMNDFRTRVSGTFSGMEIENQKTMNLKDTALTNVKLSVYFGHLWVKLKDMATPFIPKSKTAKPRPILHVPRTHAAFNVYVCYNSLWCGHATCF